MSTLFFCSRHRILKRACGQIIDLLVLVGGGGVDEAVGAGDAVIAYEEVIAGEDVEAAVGMIVGGINIPPARLRLVGLGKVDLVPGVEYIPLRVVYSAYHHNRFYIGKTAEERKKLAFCRANSNSAKKRSVDLKAFHIQGIEDRLVYHAVIIGNMLYDIVVQSEDKIVIGHIRLIYATEDLGRAYVIFCRLVILLKANPLARHKRKKHLLWRADVAASPHGFSGDNYTRGAVIEFKSIHGHYPSVITTSS